MRRGGLANTKIEEWREDLRVQHITGVDKSPRSLGWKFCKAFHSLLCSSVDASRVDIQTVAKLG